MRFAIEEDVFDLFPGLRVIGTVVTGVDNRAEHGGVRALWDTSWNEASRLGGHYPNAQSHPNVAAWRDSLKRVGVSVTRLAVEHR